MIKVASNLVHLTHKQAFNAGGRAVIGGGLGALLGAGVGGLGGAVYEAFSNTKDPQILAKAVRAAAIGAGAGGVAGAGLGASGIGSDFEDKANGLAKKLLIAIDDQARAQIARGKVDLFAGGLVIPPMTPGDLWAGNIGDKNK